MTRSERDAPVRTTPVQATPLQTPPRRDDARAMALIMAFGWTGTAFQVLGRGLAHWFDGDRGMVAYFDTGSAWVAAGEPIAARADSIAVGERFVEAAARQGRRASFFATEGMLASSPRFRRMQIGEQPVWDPRRWQDDVRVHKSLREQLRRARAKGVVVRQLAPSDVATAESPMRATLDALVARWQAARPMAAMHFLVDVAPFDHADARRMLIAERVRDSGAREVVALLSLAPVPLRGGWLFEHLLRDPAAPNGTAELLIDAAMRALADAQVRWVTLGLAPLSGEVNRWLRAARQLSRPFFNFAGLAAFKRKLRPQHWEPVYVAFPREAIGMVAVLDGLRAFADGSAVRFALRTALRGPTPLLQLLEWLLVPWTIVLALAPVVPWFPSRAVQVAWVCFDVALFVALRWQRRTRGLRLARLVAVAVSADAVLTMAQAFWWNVPRVRGTADVVILGIACAGPLIAAVVLWGAVRRMGVLRRGSAR